MGGVSVPKKGLFYFVSTPAFQDKKNYPIKTIDYFFSQNAYLAVDGIGYRGNFNSFGTITTVQIGNKFIASVSIGAWSGVIPDNSGGQKYNQINFYGNVTLFSNGSAISRQATKSDDVFGKGQVIYSANGNYPMPAVTFDLRPVSPMELGIGFQMTYQYFTPSGSANPTYNPGDPRRAWLNAYKIIYSNYPSR